MRKSECGIFAPTLPNSAFPIRRSAFKGGVYALEITE
jgi:hypothetical protein